MNTSSDVGELRKERLLLATILFWTGLFLICVFVWVSCDAELVCMCVSFHCVVFHGGGSGGEGLILGYLQDKVFLNMRSKSKKPHNLGRL